MTRRTVKRVIMTAACAYAGSYLVLSLLGRYEPAVIGSAGVKWYKWAPRGFVTDFKDNRTLTYFYFPLLLLDVHCWHTHDRARSGWYPVNEVTADEIGKVYEAWDTGE